MTFYRENDCVWVECSHDKVLEVLQSMLDHGIIVRSLCQAFCMRVRIHRFGTSTLQTTGLTGLVSSFSALSGWCQQGFNKRISSGQHLCDEDPQRHMRTLLMFVDCFFMLFVFWCLMFFDVFWFLVHLHSFGIKINRVKHRLSPGRQVSGQNRRARNLVPCVVSWGVGWWNQPESYQWEIFRILKWRYLPYIRPI